MGVTASLIDGKTTHIIGAISSVRNETHITAETKAKSQHFQKHKCYLIVDKFSMLAKFFFVILSWNIGIGKKGGIQHVESGSFGSINVIICDDFHQFPPVAQPFSSALYWPLDLLKDSIDSQLSHVIYKEFSTIVILKEQMHITNHVFLQHLSHGQVQEWHISLLRSLIIGCDPMMEVDFEEDPWEDVCLVTTCHAVQNKWNKATASKTCIETHCQLFICPTEDTIGSKALMHHESYLLESCKSGKGRKWSKDLTCELELTIGMDVMVTNNIETDLDMTNGAQGKIVEIVLHPE